MYLLILWIALIRNFKEELAGQKSLFVGSILYVMVGSGGGVGGCHILPPFLHPIELLASMKLVAANVPLIPLPSQSLQHYWTHLIQYKKTLRTNFAIACMQHLSGSQPPLSESALLSLLMYCNHWVSLMLWWVGWELGVLVGPSFSLLISRWRGGCCRFWVLVGVAGCCHRLLLLLPEMPE